MKSKLNIPFWINIRWVMRQMKISGIKKPAYPMIAGTSDWDFLMLAYLGKAVANEGIEPFLIEVEVLASKIGFPDMTFESYIEKNT